MKWKMTFVYTECPQHWRKLLLVASTPGRHGNARAM